MLLAPLESCIGKGRVSNRSRSDCDTHSGSREMAQFYEVDQGTKLSKHPKITLGGELPTTDELSFNSENSHLMAHALNRLFIAVNNRIIVSGQLSWWNFNVTPTAVWNDALELEPGSPVSHLAFSLSGKFFILVRSPAFYLYSTDDVIQGAQEKLPVAFLQWRSFPVETEAIRKFEFSPISPLQYAYILDQKLFSGEIVKPETADTPYRLNETRRLENFGVLSFVFMPEGRRLVGLAEGTIMLCDRSYETLARFNHQDNFQRVTRLHCLTEDTVLVQFRMAGQWGPNKLRTLKIYEDLEYEWGVVKGLKDKNTRDEFICANVPFNGGLSFFSFCNLSPMLINTFHTVGVIRSTRRMFPISSSPGFFSLAAVSISRALHFGTGNAFILGSDFAIYPFSVSNKDALTQDVVLLTERSNRTLRWLDRMDARDDEYWKDFNEWRKTINAKLKDMEETSKANKIRWQKEKELKDVLEKREQEVELREAEVKKREDEVRKMVEDLMHFNRSMDALKGDTS